MTYRHLLNAFLATAALTILSGCSAHCNCPTCPNAQSAPTTTIIHEPESNQ